VEAVTVTEPLDGSTDAGTVAGVLGVAVSWSRTLPVEDSTVIVVFAELVAIWSGPGLLPVATSTDAAPDPAGILALAESSVVVIAAVEGGVIASNRTDALPDPVAVGLTVSV
jgi:hypothetical protein